MLQRADDVIYRPYQESDRDEIVDLIAKTWYPNVERDLSLKRGNLELNWHLAHQDHTSVARVGDKLGGLIFARSPELTLKTDMMHDFMQLTKELCEDDPVMQEVKWLSDEVEAIKSVDARHPNSTAGWLELLIVSPEVRGFGLGKKLYNQGIEHLAKHGASHYRLLTDDDCDWSFYEHDNMTRLGAFADEDNFNVYVYEKKID